MIYTNDKLSAQPDYSHFTVDIDNIHNIRLCIKAIYHSATIEMISFHDVKWYINRINNTQDASIHIGYARSIPDVDEKMKHYLC